MRTLGRLILETREARKLSQKNLCVGLCSIQKLSNIESDERVPDVFILEYLLERLGLAADEIETVLYHDEYREIQLRRNILLAVEKGQWDFVHEQLRENFSQVREKDTIKLQFYYLILALMDQQKDDIGSCIENLRLSIKCTQPNFDIEKKTKICLSIHELQILCMLVEQYMETDVVEADKLLAFLLWYTEETPIQEMELIKIYPKIVYLLSKSTVDTMKRVEYLLRYEKAFRLLVDNDSTAFLPEIMEVLISEYEEMHLYHKANVLRKQLTSLREFCEEFGGGLYVSGSSIKWFKDSYRKSYLLCSELIKEERQARNMKYTDLIDGIYEDIETLVRIENGIQNPSHRKYSLLMERLHLPKDKYHSLQIREGEEVFEIDRRITSLYAKHEYESAKIELEKLKLLMDTEDCINRQYLMKQEALISIELKEISATEFTEKVRAALKETYFDEAENSVRTPTIEEASLFNLIGISFRRQKMLDAGIHVYENVLKCFRDSKIDFRDSYRSIILLLRNYILLLEEVGEKDKVLEVTKWVIKYEIESYRGWGIDFLSSEFACIYDEMETKEVQKEKAIERYIRYAFYISDLFGRKTNNQLCDKYYKEKFSSNIVWYE